MDTNYKISVFENEINAIKDEELKELATKLVSELIPDYFWDVAASSTGKYHPSYALGKGGLVRHTIAATRIAIGMFPLTQFSELEKDYIIIALLMHDSMKHGLTYSKYSKADHPVIAAQAVMAFCDMYSDANHGNVLYNLIITHMGQWNTDWKTKREIMPKPSTSMQRYVHMCDYLASRKYLEFNFEEVVKRD